MKDTYDHHDARLILELYDLRREPVMRESRHAIATQFWPRSYAEISQLMASMDQPLGAAFRQVSSYWEMAYGFSRRGIISPDFLLESSGEGLFLFAKVEPFVAQIREEMSPFAFVNTEWITTATPETKERFGRIRARVEGIRAAK